MGQAISWPIAQYLPYLPGLLLLALVILALTQAGKLRVPAEPITGCAWLLSLDADAQAYVCESRITLTKSPTEIKSPALRGKRLTVKKAGDCFEIELCQPRGLPSWQTIEPGNDPASLGDGLWLRIE